MEHYFPYQNEFKERRHNKYAIIIYLPPALDNIIAPLRQQFDPVYNLIASHITLVFPFETIRPLEELTKLVKTETEQQKSFLVDLEEIGDFYPQSPVIYWDVQKNDKLYELYYRLYSRLDLPIPFKLYHPHVTVAREISNYRVIIVKEKIVSYLSHEKFYVRSIDLVTSLSDERWVSVRTFPLNG